MLSSRSSHSSCILFVACLHLSGVERSVCRNFCAQWGCLGVCGTVVLSI